MRRVTKLGVVAVIASGVIGGSAAAVSAHSDRHDRGDRHHQRSAITHVLLISVDGMHQSDLDWYIANHPGSELARLASGGAEFTNNHTSDPSDSDPGGTAIMTGGDPQASPASTTTSSTATACSHQGRRTARVRSRVAT